MGKPFDKEIDKVFDTLEWALNQDVSDFRDQLLATEAPILVIGSGGSLSACHYAVSLFQDQGIIAKAMTPLELYNSQSIIRNCIVLFISASGKNTDILFSYEFALRNEPKKMISICMRTASPLAERASKCAFSFHYEFDIPTGKDGFLATNSLVAFFGYLFKALSVGPFETEKPLIPANFWKDLDIFRANITADFTFCVLFGGWSQPVAIDIESKLAEAALGDVLISDYRNFGHGRHHWFDKRKKSAIVALVTNNERDLANLTLRLLPETIPVLTIDVEESTPFATILLLFKAFRFISMLGDMQNLDPGRPGVPSYGSKLYNLKYAKTFKRKEIELTDIQVSAFRRKGVNNFLDVNERGYWLTAYRQFTSALFKTTFGSIIFDYDGTLCSNNNRYSGISQEIADQLKIVLENKIIIGIATGRGKSVREDLEQKIPKKYHKQILIGYYNCADIASLQDKNHPQKSTPASPILESVYQVISTYKFPIPITAELKPNQITIEITNKLQWKKVRPAIIQLVATQNAVGINILESTHSMDIVDQNLTSKLQIVTACQMQAQKANLSLDCLCIGDKGIWPGNDYLLLSKKYSLSVDESSPLSDSCWNLCPPGVKNILGTLYYLKNLNYVKSGAIINL